MVPKRPKAVNVDWSDWNDDNDDDSVHCFWVCQLPLANHFCEYNCRFLNRHIIAAKNEEEEEGEEARCHRLWRFLSAKSFESNFPPLYECNTIEQLKLSVHQNLLTISFRFVFFSAPTSPSSCLYQLLFFLSHKANWNHELFYATIHHHRYRYSI